MLGVQAATDSYIYTFRGFSISRFVECTRAKGGGSERRGGTANNAVEDLYLSEVAELVCTCLAGRADRLGNRPTDGLPEIPRILPPPSIANESLSPFPRPGRFDFSRR